MKLQPMSTAWDTQLAVRFGWPPAAGVQVPLRSADISQVIKAGRHRRGREVAWRALADLFAATALLCIVLAAFAVARKLRRDRNEVRFRARREQFARLVSYGSLDSLTQQFRQVAYDSAAQLDLAIALLQAGPWLDRPRRELLRRAVAAARLDRALTRRLRWRDPVARATAVLLISRLRLAGSLRLLGPLVHDEDGDVALVAARAIAELADGVAAGVLIGALDAAALAPERLIERLGDCWAVDAILQVLCKRADDREPAPRPTRPPRAALAPSAAPPGPRGRRSAAGSPGRSASPPIPARSPCCVSCCAREPARSV